MYQYQQQSRLHTREMRPRKIRMRSVTDSAGNIQMSVTAQCEERNGQCGERNGQCGERNGLDLLGLIIMKLLGVVRVINYTHPVVSSECNSNFITVLPRFVNR